MAASKKSTVLGLCLWEGTDKPRRVDFVADNEAIESQLGGHIQNDNLHLNDTRRKRLDTPTEVRTYTGTLWMLVTEGWRNKIVLLIAIANVLLFFGRDFVSKIRSVYRRYKYRRDANQR